MEQIVWLHEVSDDELQTALDESRVPKGLSRVAVGSMARREGTTGLPVNVAEQLATLGSDRWTEASWFQDMREALGLPRRDPALEACKAAYIGAVSAVCEEDDEDDQDDFVVSDNEEAEPVPEDCKEGFEDEPLDTSDPRLTSGARYYRSVVNSLYERYNPRRLQ